MSFNFFRTVAIDHTQAGSSDTANWTCLVFFSDATLKTTANGGHVNNANGYDIVFSSTDDGSSLLTWDLAFYDGANGIVAAWVLISNLSHAVDENFYMVYGDASISTFQGGSHGSAWNANYWQIYHLQESAGPYIDATVNGNDASGGTNPSQVTGTFGKAQLFNGTNQYIEGPNFHPTQNPIYCSAWVNWPTIGGGLDFFIIDTRVSLAQAGWIMTADALTTGTKPTVYINNNGPISSATSLDDNNWHYWVMISDGTNLRLIIDGTIVATNPAVTPASTTAGDFRLGASSDTTILFGKQTIQEVRIAGATISADQITADFNSQKPSQTMVTIGSESSGANPIDEVITDTFPFGDQVILGIGLIITGDTNAGNWADHVTFDSGVPGISIEDSFTFSDAFNGEIDYFLPFSDSLPLTDGFFQPSLNMVAENDALIFSDDLLLQLAVAVDQHDAFSFSDLVKAVGLILLSNIDTLSLSDSLGLDVPFFNEFFDNFILRDAQTVAWSKVMNPLIDDFAFSDSIVIDLLPFWTVLNENVSDNFNLSDSVLFGGNISPSAADILSLSDGINVNLSFNPFNQSLSDSFSMVDGVLIIFEGELIQIADSLSFSDSVLVTNGTDFNSYIRRYLNDLPA